MKIQLKEFYHDERTIEGISSIEIELKEGVQALIGPSGSGKTTLLKAIEKEYQATYLSEINDQVSVLDFLATDENSARSALSDVELDIKVYHPLQSLSSGQKKRVLLAKILVEREKVYLLDEVFVGLDEELRKSLLDFLKRIALERNHKILYVTHQLEDVLDLYVHVLISGNIKEKGSFKNLYEKSQYFEVARFLGPFNHLIAESKEDYLETPLGKFLTTQALTKGHYLLFFRPEKTLVQEHGLFKANFVTTEITREKRLVHLSKNGLKFKATFLLEKDLKEEVSFSIEDYQLWKL